MMLWCFAQTNAVFEFKNPRGLLEEINTATRAKEGLCLDFVQSH